jgi:hypothetical protein
MDGFGLILASLLIETIALILISKVKAKYNIIDKIVKKIVLLVCASIFFQTIFVLGKLYLYLIYNKII